MFSVKKPEPPKNDIPPGPALALLAAVLGGLLYARHHERADEVAKAVEAILTRNEMYLWLVFGSVIFNGVIVSFIVTKSLSKKKQGRLLNNTLGKKDELKLPTGIWIKLNIAAVVFGVCFVLFPALNIKPSEYYALGDGIVLWTDFLIRLSISVTISIIASLIGMKKGFFGFKREPKKALPPFPEESNSLTIGSIDEESEPKWISLGGRALNGNVLVVGSIGSGKSQGTILSYLQQIMFSFNPKPAILVIDPKHSVSSEVLKLAEKSQYKKSLLHLRLGGDVKFNPIYLKDGLKDSRFLSIAGTIQAVARNFAQESSHEKIWDELASNLIRHSLVYLIACKGYYTLLDIYDTLVTAVDGKIADELYEKHEEEGLSEEQKFNIERAALYFNKEYSTLDEKLRSSILITATRFISQFQEYQAAKIFCPPENEITLHSIDEVVDGGKLLVLDVKIETLARSMGTFVKLHYEKSVLSRLEDDARDRSIPAVMVVDEYQEVVSVGDGKTFGDDKYFAKAREANAISLVATQGLISIENTLRSQSLMRGILQSFKTSIFCQSTDITTIDFLKEIVGQEEREKVSTGVSETGQDATVGFSNTIESKRQNVSESVNVSTERVDILTAKDISSLQIFESFALIFDGIQTSFHKLFLKPYLLPDRAMTHDAVIDHIKELDRKAQNKLSAGIKVAATSFAILIGGISIGTGKLQAFPNVCSVVKSSDFESCMDLSISGCVCGTPPHPCSQVSYYLPETFVETLPQTNDSFFKTLPGATAQLNALPPSSKAPFGEEGELDSQSFQAHALSVPFLTILQNLLPCGGSFSDTTCFQAMSEHLGPLWSSGSGDAMQPQFLAWGASPKACITLGAARSLAGGEMGIEKNNIPSCSFPGSFSPIFPPSPHSACNGWGLFYPRCGTHQAPSQTIGALMIASRIKSLGSEVFMTLPSSSDEKWQMIEPQGSACFREGENTLFIETFRRAQEAGRLSSGKFKGHLFTVWRKRSCCVEISGGLQAAVVTAAAKAACMGMSF